MLIEGLRQPTDAFTTEYFPSGRRPKGAIVQSQVQDNRQVLDWSQERSTYYNNHIQTSRRAILEAVQGLRGEALICGLGNAMEIPYQALVEQFDRVTILEVDEAAVRRSTLLLPTSLQARVHLVIDDLSGVWAQSEEATERAQRRAKNLPSFIASMTERLRHLQPHPPQLEQLFDFVCSSLVMTQLNSRVGEHMQEIGESRFSMPRLHPDQYPSFFEAFTHLSHQIQSEHIQFLRRHTKESGRVYFSDTLYKESVIRHPLTGAIVPISGPGYLFGGDQLLNTINQNFNIGESYQWDWLQTPPPPGFYQPSTPGQNFRVIGTVLTPR